MKLRNLAVFPALFILVLAGIATAAGGYRTAYQPNGSGLWHNVNGVEALDASTLQIGDVAGDASTGWAPLVLADGGVAWGAVASSGGSTVLAGDVVGDAGANTVTRIQGAGVSATPPTQYQALLGSYGGTGTWTPYTITGDVTLSGTGAPLAYVGTAQQGCFGFGTSGVMTLGKSSAACSGSQSITSYATSGATGASMSLTAGSTSGATGGALFLSSGSGASAGGSIELLPSGSTAQGINYLPTGTWQWFNTATAPGFTQAAATTASGTGAAFTIQAQNETGTTSTGGAFNISSGTGTSAAGGVNVQIGGTTLGAFSASGGLNIVTTGTTNSRGLTVAGLTGISSNGSNMWVGSDSVGSTGPMPNNMNVVGFTNVILNVGGLTPIINASSSQVALSKPIVGDGSASPYSVHGYGSLSVAGGSPVTVGASTYSNHYIDLTGAITANITVTLPAGNGAEWCVANATTGAFTITLKDVGDTGSGVALTTPGVTTPTFCKRVYSDGTRLRTAE